MDHKAPQEPIKFKSIMVATDGSEKSRESFDQALQFFDNTKIFEKLYVCHISNAKKTYLKKEYSVDSIYCDYRSECLSREQSSKYSSCRDQILDMTKQLNCTFLFIGYTGRKGEKSDPTVLSSTVKQAFQASVPLIITKQLVRRDQTSNGGFQFLVCVDGSIKSLKALLSTFKMADKKDQVIACFVPTPEKKSNLTNQIRAEVDSILKDQKTIKNCLQELEPTYDTGDALVKFINETDKFSIDFVVIGNNGYRAQTEKKTFFGRTAEKILCSAKANPIVYSTI